MRVADYIIDKLYQKDVHHIFMVTGRGALFLTDAVAAHKKMTAIAVHHEQSAAFAAVSYSNCNEKLGACLVSTGCASTNTITGVLNAWQDAIPTLFISGQNKLKETSRYTQIPIRTYGQQEADIVSLVEPITKYAVMITDPKKVVYEVEKAIHLAQEGRKGPVWIDIPLDVQNMRINPEELEHFMPEEEIKLEPIKEDIDYVVKSLNEAKRPTVLIGTGVRASNSVNELINFIEEKEIPLTYSASATDIYGFDNNLSFGSVGIMGCSRVGNFTVQNSDLVLVLGSRLSSMTVGEKDKFAREAKVIVVDIDEIEHSKCAVNIDRLILSDIKELIQRLAKEKIEKTDKKWIEKCNHWKTIFPICEEQYQSKEEVDLYQLANAISNTLPENATLHTDSGMIELILPTNVKFKKNQKSIHPASQGAMGVVLPSVIGAYYTNQDAAVVAVVGDGSIMMNLQELETIRYNKIPAKIFIVNNNAYAVIRKRQNEMFRSRTIGTDPQNGVGCPDFEKVANTFDFKYIRIETVQNLEEQINSIFNTKGFILCEIMGLEDQSYISSGHAKTQKGKIVARPIEDQSPYLDRKLFLEEMIIEPIDQ